MSKLPHFSVLQVFYFCSPVGDPLALADTSLCVESYPEFLQRSRPFLQCATIVAHQNVLPAAHQIPTNLAEQGTQPYY